MCCSSVLRCERRADTWEAACRAVRGVMEDRLQVDRKKLSSYVMMDAATQWGYEACDLIGNME